VEQVTALELRKNLAEITRQVRDERQKKVLVVHGEENIGLVSVEWAKVADQADEVSAQQSDMNMNQDLAKILHAQADLLAKSKEPIRLSTVINTFVDHAMIFSKYKALDQKLTPTA
jgi:isopentenyl phosphate kinase